MRLLKVLCGVAALTVLLPSDARADDYNKKTILTFSGPVQIPGVTLAAGTYVFKLADISDRHVVQVFDKDEKRLYTTMLALPNKRLEPTDKPIVLFSERASGSPQAVKVWYYPGETVGNEFVYPKTQAMQIARETHQRVLSTNSETTSASAAGEIPVEAKTAAVGYFDETGNWQSEANSPIVMSNATAASAKAGAAPGSAGTQTAGTSGIQRVRTQLPRTAGSLALVELISAVALAGGLSLRRFRRHSA